MAKSPKKSFEGWQITKWLKGRRKTIIALIGAAIGYATTNDVVISAGSALAFEALIGIIEFYFKEIQQ